MAHYFKNVIRAKGSTAAPPTARITRKQSTGQSGLGGPRLKFTGDLQYLDADGRSAHDHSIMAETINDQSSAWLAAKRVLDLLFASGLLLLAAPVLIVCALAVALTSRGPVLFTQERIGTARERHGGLMTWRLRTFTMYKFRSMYVGLDDEAHRRLTEALITGDKKTTETLATTPGLLKLSDDPRITPVGRFLRRFSLDELPQLFNVIKGDMSIIGPRPALQYEVDHYLPWHMGRFNAKPGITGLWQVMGRSALSFEEMVRLDIQYARQQSFILDLRILLKTFGVVLTGKGAA